MQEKQFIITESQKNSIITIITKAIHPAIAMDKLNAFVVSLQNLPVLENEQELVEENATAE